MRRLLCAIAVLCAAGWAQTATVTGQINDPSATSASKNTQVEFALKGCGGNAPRYNGTAAITGDSDGSNIAITYPLNSIGQIVSRTGGTATIYRSDYITCGTSTDSNKWAMTIIRNGARGAPCDVRITAATFDATQPSCLNISPTLPVVSDATVFAKLDASNTPFSGNVRTKKLNDVRLSDQFASITAACADLAGAQGSVWIPSSVASSDPSTSVASKCQVWDWRGVGAMNGDNFTTANTKGLSIYQTETATNNSNMTFSMLNVTHDLYAGGQNTGGDKSNYISAMFNTIGRVSGQRHSVSAAIFDRAMGDAFALTGTINTSGGNQSGRGDEGKYPFRGVCNQDNAVFTATVVSVAGGVITYTSDSNEKYLGMDRFLINTSANVYSTGTATTVASSATITEGGGADWEAATVSGVLDASSNPRFGFSLDGETVSTLKYVTPITAVPVAGTTATLRDVWAPRVAGTTGAYKIFKGSVVTAVNPFSNTVTVSDGTQFAAGNTIELPLDNRFTCGGLLFNINQQIATSGLGTGGVTVANSNSAARALADDAFTATGNFNRGLEFNGHTIAQSRGIFWNTGPIPAILLAASDNSGATGSILADLGVGSDSFRMSMSASAHQWLLGSSSINTLRVGNTAVATAIGANFATTTALFITPTNTTDVGVQIQGNLDSALKVNSANNANWVEGSASELLTLSTSGATTDTSANLLPANSIIEGVVARVTTTITTATDWSIGDPTTATRFASANAVMTAGSTSVGLNHWKGGVSTEATGPTQTSAAKVRITTTGTPGAGVIRITVFYKTFSAPTN